MQFAQFEANLLHSLGNDIWKFWGKPVGKWTLYVRLDEEPKAAGMVPSGALEEIRN